MYDDCKVNTNGTVRIRSPVGQNNVDPNTIVEVRLFPDIELYEEKKLISSERMNKSCSTSFVNLCN